MLFIIVPYADFQPEEKRAEELAQFLAHFKAAVPVVFRENVYVYIVEQVAPRAFNRGLLLNIGVKGAMEEAGRQSVPDERVVIVTHDVDLLPDDDLLRQYDPLPADKDAVSMLLLDDAYREAYGEIVIAAGGGITATRLSTYKKVNGYPNDFWRYGMEDFVFTDRLNRVKARVGRATVGALLHIDTIRKTGDKRAYLREHKLKNMQAKEQRQADRSRWRQNGLHRLPPYTVNAVVDDRVENCIVKHIKCSLTPPTDLSSG